MKLNLKEYIIKDDTMIIHDDVCKDINFNTDFIQIKKVIFEKFDINNYSIKNKNIVIVDETIYIRNKFSIVLNENITHLTLSTSFNNSIELTNNLVHLIFGYCFNNPIILPNNSQLTHLTFGYCFDKPIILPNNSRLTHLIFGSSFNHPLDLTNANQLTYLTFEHKFNYLFELPDSLVHLSLSFEFNQPIKLNNNLHITQLTFGYHFNQPIELTDKLTHLTLGFRFNQPIQFTEKSQLTHLILGYHFNQPIQLTNLKYLEIRSSDNNFFENLPSSLESLVLTFDSAPLLNNLPNSLKYLDIQNIDYDEKLDNLPDSIEIIQIEINYSHQIKKIPKNLREIKCSKYYEFLDDFLNLDLDKIMLY